MRDWLILHLEAVEPASLNDHRALTSGHQVRFIAPPGDPERVDLADPDVGILYWLHVRELHTGRSQAAAELLAYVLRLLERQPFRLDQTNIIHLSMQCLRMAGVEAESRSIGGKAKKPRAPALLQTRLLRVARSYPGEHLDNLLSRLEADRVVTHWDAEGIPVGRVMWLDEGGSEQSTARSTVRGWLSKR
jgi:hypothetical protein